MSSTVQIENTAIFNDIKKYISNSKSFLHSRSVALRLAETLFKIQKKALNGNFDVDFIIFHQKDFSQSLPTSEIMSLECFLKTLEIGGFAVAVFDHSYKERRIQKKLNHFYLFKRFSLEYYQKLIESLLISVDDLKKINESPYEIIDRPPLMDMLSRTNIERYNFMITEALLKKAKKIDIPKPYLFDRIENAFKIEKGIIKPYGILQMGNIFLTGSDFEIYLSQNAFIEYATKSKLFKQIGHFYEKKDFMNIPKSSLKDVLDTLRRDLRVVSRIPPWVSAALELYRLNTVALVEREEVERKNGQLIEEYSIRAYNSIKGYGIPMTMSQVNDALEEYRDQFISDAFHREFCEQTKKKIVRYLVNVGEYYIDQSCLYEAFSSLLLDEKREKIHGKKSIKESILLLMEEDADRAFKVSKEERDDLFISPRKFNKRTLEILRKNPFIWHLLSGNKKQTMLNAVQEYWNKRPRSKENPAHPSVRITNFITDEKNPPINTLLGISYQDIKSKVDNAYSEIGLIKKISLLPRYWGIKNKFKEPEFINPKKYINGTSAKDYRKP